MSQIPRQPPSSDTPRWVLDTNVVLSALVRVLAYPRFKLTPAEQRELLSDFLPWAETVKVPAPPPSAPACRDSDNVPFLELALAARAQALVTGDADLLVLAPIPDLDIITPAQAVEHISTQAFDWHAWLVHGTHGNYLSDGCLS